VHYPAQLIERYKLGDISGLNDEELLTAIGRKRGAMLSGGRVNLQKAAEVLIYEFRQCILGRITLETPEEFKQWAAKAEAAEAARKAKADARKARRKGSGVREASSGSAPEAEGEHAEDGASED